MAQQNFWATNEIYRIHVWVWGDWGVFVCLASNCFKKKVRNNNTTPRIQFKKKCDLFVAIQKS